jgi:hypothetical protein
MRGNSHAPRVVLVLALETPWQHSIVSIESWEFLDRFRLASEKGEFSTPHGHALPCELRYPASQPPSMLRSFSAQYWPNYPLSLNHDVIFIRSHQLPVFEYQS